jgi:hypothetical protein
MSIGGDEYVYQPASQMLSGPKGSMPIPLNAGRLQMRILVDRTTVEIFGDRGQAYGMFVRNNPGGNALLALHTWKLGFGAHACRKVDRPLTTIYLVDVTVFEAG